MSRNYDNWERLVAAVVKREQIWQLCHQDSISTICSSDYSCRHLDLSSPISLGSPTRITETFKFVQRLRERAPTTVLSLLLQDVHVSDNIYFEAGTKAVIKSLPNNVYMTEDEFEQQMIVVGNTRHENVAVPWAYFSSETTKILVYDYYSDGSVFDILHGAGKGGRDRPSWESSMRIAIGAARGIAHIHTQCGEKLAHGNIKSSNIFLNSQNYGCVSEHKFWTSTFSQKSDVYSFGLVLLELITPEPPMEVSYTVKRLQSCEPDECNIERLRLGELVDEMDMWLVYVDQQLRESGTIEWLTPGVLLVDELEMWLPKLSVYVDRELMESGVLQQVRGTLQVANRCLSLLAEDRPIMGEVVLQLEKIAKVGGRKYISRRGVKKAVWQRFLHFPFGR